MANIASGIAGPLVLRTWTVVWLASAALVAGMMDTRHFALGTVRTVKFADPGVGPPSLIYSKDQNGPPYDIDQPHMEPFPGCDARYSLVCSVQHSIRLVTRARIELCPELAAGGARREAALARISNNTITAEGTSGFGLFAFAKNGTIIADALKPDVIGTRIDGVAASGYVAQATLLDYVDWVVRWSGGFVPHFTMRLRKTVKATPLADADLNLAPDSASMYVEACSATGERLGVAFARAQLPTLDLCDALSNAFCSVVNVRSIVGLALVDMLNGAYYEQHKEIQQKISYGSYYTVKDFYLYVYQLSDQGYPGPNPFNNRGLLENTLGTNLAHNTLKTITGTNLTWMGGFIEGIRRGDWLISQINNAAWTGGAWRTYLWQTPALGVHFKLAMTLGFVWNGTGYMVGGGTTHQPSKAAKAANCATCSAAYALPCTAANIQRLVAHVAAELLTPGGVWRSITNDDWFGAMHPNRPANQTYADTWPTGFYSFAFDYNGTCVADGKVNTNVGRSVTDVVGDAAHSSFKAKANNGGGWVQYSEADGTVHVAYVVKVAKWQRFFYAVGAFKKEMAPWAPDCSLQYSEPCSTSNAETIVGMANAEIVASPDQAALQTTLKNLADRTGAFSSLVAGDFAVSVYDSWWMCPDSTSLAGAACPRPIPPTWNSSLTAASNKEEGSWTLLQPTDKDPSYNAFVFRTRWSPRSTNAIQKVLFLVVYVNAAPGPLRCPSNSCPVDAGCSPSGRCKCNTGFRTKFTMNNTFCGQLKPASMKCIDVRGLDCTGIVGDVPCPPCTAGFFCPEGQPLPCPPGQYCAEGSANPALCPSGTMGASSRAAGPDSCLPCSRGTVALSGGQTACEACPSGKFSSKTGMSSCDLCKIGAFQPTAGMSECMACEGVLAGSTTPFLGVSEVSGCICPEAWYLPKGGNKCLDCPVGMSCKLGSDMKNLDSLSGPFPILLPRFWSSTSNPLSVFSCKSEAKCPGGPPGTCAAHSTAQSCAHCEENYFWNGKECSKCASDGASSFVYPALPLILIPAIIIGLYATSMNANIIKWRGWENQFVTGGFILLNFFQIIDIVGSTQATKPQKMNDLYAGFNFFTDFLTVFKPSCAGFATLSSSMLTKSLAPIGVAIICLALYYLSVLLSKVFKRPRIAMEKNCLFNIYGGIMYTFFGAIAAMSMDLFKCSQNPNGSQSMISDPSVTCYNSDEWTGMVVVAIISTLVYVLGATLGFLVVLHMAKTRYSEPSFRQRWMFLFVKYQHGAYWWGLVYLSRNFMVNLSLVIFPVAMYQCTTVMIISLIYLTFVALVWPYRSDFCNRAEIFCTLSVVINAAVMSAFALAYDLNTQTSSVDIVGVVTYLPTVTCAAVLGYLLFMGLQMKFKIFGGRFYIDRDNKKVKDLAKSLGESFTLVAGISTEDLAELLLFLSDSEIYCLRNVDVVLRSEFGAEKDTKNQRFQAKRLTSKKFEGKRGSVSQSSDLGVASGPVHAPYFAVVI